MTRYGCLVLILAVLLGVFLYVMFRHILIPAIDPPAAPDRVTVVVVNPTLPPVPATLMPTATPVPEPILIVQTPSTRVPTSTMTAVPSVTPTRAPQTPVQRG